MNEICSDNGQDEDVASTRITKQWMVCEYSAVNVL